MPRKKISELPYWDPRRKEYERKIEDRDAAKRSKMRDAAINRIMRGKFDISDTTGVVSSIERRPVKGRSWQRTAKVTIDVNGKFEGFYYRPHDRHDGNRLESWGGKITLDLPDEIESKFRLGQKFSLSLVENKGKK